MEKFRNILKKICALAFVMVLALPLVACGKSANVKGEAYGTIKKDVINTYLNDVTTTTKMSSYTLRMKAYSSDILKTNIKINVTSYANRVDGDGFIYMDDSTTVNYKFTFNSTRIEWWDYESIFVTTSKHSYNHDMVSLFAGKAVDFSNDNNPTLSTYLVSEAQAIIGMIESCVYTAVDCKNNILDDEDNDENEVTTYYKSYENKNKYKINYKCTLPATMSSAASTEESNFEIEFDNYNRYSKGIYTYESGYVAESGYTYGNKRYEISIVRNGYQTA